MISIRMQFQIISSHRMARRRRSRHVRHGQNCQADRLLPLSLPCEACMDRELSVHMTEFSLSRLPRIEFGAGVLARLPTIARGYGAHALLVTGAGSLENARRS